MSIPLNVLIVSGASSVVDLVRQTLRVDGFDPHCLQISSPDALEPALSARDWDATLVDLTAATLNITDVLLSVRSTAPFQPVIVLDCDCSEISRRMGRFINDVDARVPMNALGQIGAVIRRVLPRAGLDHSATVKDPGSSTQSADWSAEMAIVHEVSQRIRAEDALCQSEELFREIAENIRQVFFVRDLQRDRMIYVSPSYESMWGRSREMLYEDPTDFLRYVHPDDREQVTAARNNQDERHPVNLEFRILHPDGTVRWMSGRRFPIRDRFGKFYRVAGLVEDITESKLSERKRLDTEMHHRDTLIREVHHRIKNNLQGVVGLLRQHAIEHPEVKAPLEGAISRVNAIAMVHGLQGRVPGDGVRLCDMVEVICRTAVDLTGVAIKPDVERVLARPVLVSQEEAVPVALIVNELMFNAVKHSGVNAASASLHVVVDHDDTRAWVRILNSGAHLPDGFDFASGSGLGTGLTLVKSLFPRTAADLSIREEEQGVVALLSLRPPNVVLM